jgi:hypothetical protein
MKQSIRRLARIETKRRLRAFNPHIDFDDPLDVARLIEDREAQCGPPLPGYGYLIMPREFPQTDEGLAQWEAWIARDGSKRC